MWDYLTVGLIAGAVGFVIGERFAYRAVGYFSEAAFSSLAYWGRFFSVDWIPRIKVKR